LIFYSLFWCCKSTSEVRPIILDLLHMIGKAVVVVTLHSSTQMPRHSQKVTRRSSPIMKTFNWNGPIHPLHSDRAIRKANTASLCSNPRHESNRFSSQRTTCHIGASPTTSRSRVWKSFKQNNERVSVSLRRVAIYKVRFHFPAIFPTQDWFNLTTYNVSYLVSWLVNGVTGRRQRILSRAPVNSFTRGFLTVHFKAAYPSCSRDCVWRFP
jgi:hypothetical protein